MKKGQTSKRGGIQDILFPMEYMNITQGNNGQYSHQGANALDLAGKDTGRDLFYAPFDVRCVATGDRNTEGNAAFWQSVNQVRFADGTVDYATIMVLHDNSLNGIYPGATYKQGVQIGQEGTAGNATGNHNHFEIAKGKFTHKYDLNKFGIYHLPRSISADQACFVDGTTILNANGMKWKKLADVQVGGAPPLRGSVSLNYRPDFYKAVRHSLLQKKHQTLFESARFVHRHIYAFLPSTLHQKESGAVYSSFPSLSTEKLKNPHPHHQDQSIPKASCQ